MYNFQGKRALVTGTGRGLGRDVAKALWAAGATTFALSKTKENLESLVAECPGIQPVCVDLTDWASTQKAVEAILPIELLVNNAGNFAMSSLLDVKESDVDEQFAVNVKGAIAVSQVVAGDMIKRQCPGVIVNVSSIMSQCARERAVAYNTSKGALDQLTRSMVLELGPSQIRVNSVHPHLIKAENTKGVWSVPENIEPINQRTPLRRIVETQEVTDTILFLLSDKASGIHGAFLPVDGGIWQAAVSGIWP